MAKRNSKVKEKARTKKALNYAMSVRKRVKVADKKPFTQSELNDYIDSGVSILLKNSSKEGTMFNNIILGMVLKSIEYLINLRNKLF